MAAIAANYENRKECDQFLVQTITSLLDEVSEVGLVAEIDDELDEVCEVRHAVKCQSSLMSWIKLVRWES